MGVHCQSVIHIKKLKEYIEKEKGVMSGDMADFITSLNTGLTPDALWGAVGALSSLIITGVLFGFGYGLIKRVVNKIRRGKGGM